jgi:hypothetical protein
MVATSKDCHELYSAKIGNLFQYDFKCFIASFATTVAGFTFCLDTKSKQKNQGSHKISL